MIRSKQQSTLSLLTTTTTSKKPLSHQSSMNFKTLTALTALAAAPAVTAGPLAYALCQTGCNGLAVACYAAAGFTFGVALPAAPPMILGCNAALGTCMAACAVTALLAPIP
ncbi:hypothetical protein J3A83DRAFT_4372086 [Scleroderma citrinum]